MHEHTVNVPPCFCCFAGVALDGPHEVLQMTEFLTHCLAMDVDTSSSHQREEQAFNTDAVKTVESPRCNKVDTNTFSISKLACYACFVVDLIHLIHTWSLTTVKFSNFLMESGWQIPVTELKLNVYLCNSGVSFSG